MEGDPYASLRVRRPDPAPADRAHGDGWAEAVLAVRHPCLARVLAAGREDADADVWAVTTEVRDTVDLRAWIATQSPGFPQRALLLGSVAAALDALHVAEPAGIAHGGLRPEAVRVDAAGAVRLAGLRPWVDDEPADLFRAPELAPGAPGTRAADTWAFARLAAEVLAGPSAAGAPDAAALVTALRTSPDTRRRPRLVRALADLLAAPPEARVVPLVAWLAGALEGTTATEVGQQAGQQAPPLSASAPADPPVTGPADVVPGEGAARRRRRLPPLSLAASGAAVALALAAGWTANGRGGATPGTGPEGADGAVAPRPVAMGTLTDDRSLGADVTLAPACGEAGALAGGSPLGELQEEVTGDALTRAADAALAGRWQRVRLLIEVRGFHPDGVLVAGLRSAPGERPTRVGPPLWRVALSGAACEGSSSTPVDDDEVWRVDLDRGTVEAPSGPGGGRRGAFVAEDEPTVMVVDVATCRSNHRWSPVLEYVDVDGVQRTLALPPVTVFGDAVETLDYTLGPQAAAAVPAGGTRFTGTARGCA